MTLQEIKYASSSKSSQVACIQCVFFYQNKCRKSVSHKKNFQ